VSEFPLAPVRPCFLFEPVSVRSGGGGRQPNE
jgi:hypothetical protein